MECSGSLGSAPIRTTHAFLRRPPPNTPSSRPEHAPGFACSCATIAQNQGRNPGHGTKRGPFSARDAASNRRRRRAQQAQQAACVGHTRRSMRPAPSRGTCTSAPSHRPGSCIGSNRAVSHHTGPIEVASSWYRTAKADRGRRIAVDFTLGATLYLVRFQTDF